VTLDLIELALVVLTFAAWIVVHVALVVGLFARAGRARGLTSLLVPVLAPYWGMRTNMGARSAVWVGLLALYVAARVAVR
jgi:hypothetical protein